MEENDRDAKKMSGLCRNDSDTVGLPFVQLAPFSDLFIMEQGPLCLVTG